MSLNRRSELRRIALVTCRELRERSTGAERILWDALRRRKLSGLKFYRQHPIFHDSTGLESYFVADFYCHEARVIVEVDGSVHDARLEADEDRTRILNALGLRVVRFSNERVTRDLRGVLAELQTICASPVPPFTSQGKGG